MAVDLHAASLRFLQTLAVLALMLVSALLAAAVAPKIKFHGPLFISWIVAEILSVTVLVVLFIESIFVFAYDLKPWDSVRFQVAKTGLWLLVILVGIIGLVATRPKLHARFVGGWVVALAVVWLIFLANLAYAIWVYRRGSHVISAEPGLVPREGDGRGGEADPLLAQQR